MGSPQCVCYVSLQQEHYLKCTNALNLVIALVITRDTVTDLIKIIQNDVIKIGVVIMVSTE